MTIRIHEGYQVKPHKEFPASSIIVTDGKGGKIPDMLSGMFTSPAIAMQTIDKYLEIKTKKE
jgi:NCAIR mutase (PurE)-related protein